MGSLLGCTHRWSWHVPWVLTAQVHVALLLHLLLLRLLLLRRQMLQASWPSIAICCLQAGRCLLLLTLLLLLVVFVQLLAALLLCLLLQLPTLVHLVCSSRCSSSSSRLGLLLSRNNSCSRLSSKSI